METEFKFQNYHFDSNDPNITITSLSSTQSAFDGTDTLPIVRSSRPAETSAHVKQGRPISLSLIAAVFLTVNTALGAGLFNLPVVFYQSGGFYVANGIQAGILLFIVGSLLLLSYCTDKLRARTYHELVEKALGSFWSSVCTYALILYSYGCCLTFLLLMEDQFKTAFASYFGSHYEHVWYMNTFLITNVCAIVFILPFCFTDSLDLLKYPSSCGVLIIGYIVWMVFQHLHSKPDPFPVEYHLKRWTDVFKCVPAICFSYQCHINWVPTFAQMNCHTRSRKTLFTVLISTGICALCYTYVCYAGIATFGGKNLDVDLIRNYDAQDPLVLIGICAFAFKIVVTYPIVLYCAREAILDQLRKVSKDDPIHLTSDGSGQPLSENNITIENVDKEPIPSPAGPFLHKISSTHKKVIVLCWFFSALVISMITPDIGYVISLLGTLAVLFMFILPGMCLIKIVTSRDPYVSKRKSYGLYAIASIYILLGVFIFGLTLAQSVQIMLEHGEVNAH